MQILKKGILIGLSTLMMISVSFVTIFAGGVWASASASAVVVGESFTVSISSSDMLVSELSVSCSGCTITSGISRKTLDTGETQTISAIMNAGSGATVSFSGVGADYTSMVEQPVSTSAYVGVSSGGGGGGGGGASNPATPNAPKEKVEVVKDKDSSLSKLSASIGTLSPQFAATSFSYTLDLPFGSKEVNLEAAATSGKATVTGNGVKAISKSEEVFVIECTSEDGQVSKYEVKAVVAQKPEVEIKIGGKSFGVISNHNGSGLSEKFKKSSISIDEKDIDTWVNEKGNMHLLYIVDEDLNSNYYLYNVKSKALEYKYIPINFDNMSFGVLEMIEGKPTRKDMKYQLLVINDIKVMGFTYNDKGWKDYNLFAGISDDGIKQMYQIETVNKKVIPLPNEEWYLESTFKTLNDSYTMMIYLAIGSSLLAVISSVFAITLGIKKRSKQKNN